MRIRLALFVIATACGGPSGQQVIETPSATAPHQHSEAPPASVDDEERHRLIQRFDDMQTTQNAYREAEQGSGAAPPPPPPPGAQQGTAAQPRTGAQQGSGAPPKRKAPVEQAPK